MGIQGLTTFIDENLHLLRDFRLCNTKVVVDGNNLYHLLFYEYNIDYQHGGDYSKFAMKTREFFKLLRMCQISPYVVFDGGYEPGNKKYNTTLERFKKRLEMAYFIAKGGRGKVLPILAYETFRQVLVEMGIPFVVSDFEADNDIAALANDLSCPVISFDSDFYILPLSGGFVPFDTVNFNVQTLTEEGRPSIQYLPARIYHSENIVKFFPNLGSKVLPLFATLLGNDYIDKRLFEAFFASVRAPKRFSSKFSIPKTHQKMIKVVTWLERLHSFDDGIEEIVKSTKPDLQDKLREMVGMSIKSFSEVPSSGSLFSLYKYFEGIEQDDPDESRSIKCFNGQVTPAWYRSAHRCGNIHMNLQNILVLHRNILSCQVENLNETSTYKCALQLRQILYGILTKTDNARAETEKTSDGDKKTQIQEVDRDRKNMKKTLVPPLQCVLGFGELPSFEDIPNIALDSRGDLLWASLGISSDDIADLAENVKFIVCVCIYWVNHSEPKVTMNHLKGLVVCVLYLNMKTRVESHDVEASSATQKVDFDQYLDQLTDAQYKSAIEKLAKYRPKKEHSKKHPMDITIVHGFSQFQACYLTAVHLNQLLLCPYVYPNPATIFSGPFLYNFVSELQARKNPDLFISEMLGRESPILALYNELISAVVKGVNRDMLGDDVSYGKSRKSRKKDTSKKCKDQIKCDEDGAQDSGDELTDDRENVAYATCQLTNRFTDLLMHTNE